MHTSDRCETPHVPTVIYYSSMTLLASGSGVRWGHVPVHPLSPTQLNGVYGGVQQSNDVLTPKYTLLTSPLAGVERCTD